MINCSEQILKPIELGTAGNPAGCRTPNKVCHGQTQKTEDQACEAIHKL